MLLVQKHYLWGESVVGIWEREAYKWDPQKCQISTGMFKKGDPTGNLKEEPNRDFERKENQIGFPKMQGPNRDYKIIDTIEIPF